MKRYGVLMFVLCAVTIHAEQVEQERYRVDGITAIVSNESNTIIITDSEMLLPGLDGQPKVLQSIIDENCIYLDAQRLGVASEDNGESNWEDMKKRNNLSEDYMQTFFTNLGYLISEVKELLNKMFTSNQMLQFKLVSELVITREAIEAYYYVHPKIEPTSYYVARALVPFSDLEDQDHMQARLLHAAQMGNVERIVWSRPFWIMHDNVAADKQFIYSMKIGDISAPVKLSQGFEIFKLIDKKHERILPLDQEEYERIAQLLRQERYEQLKNDYLKTLRDKMTVVYY